MTKKTLQAIRGMYDILSQETPLWQYVEHTFARVMAHYGYQEIRMPLAEYTQLFKRVVGEVTDVVEKEMYIFNDRDGESLSLRPEGTAGCVRAGIEHGLFYHQQQRLWYSGPMFRYDRPQKGRCRQFHQFGIEAFGMAGPDIDAEIILMTARLWKLLGLTHNDVKLHLNTLGSLSVRQQYRQKLVDYFSPYVDQLDDDSKRRLQTNPLRILDSKNPDLQLLIQEAPQLIDLLDQASREHFDSLCERLESAGVSYHINPRLVRGLDYYTHTVFEWTTQSEGAQNAICGGGRYDLLVEQMGGHPTPAFGVAIGVERLIILLSELNRFPETLGPDLQIYLVLLGSTAQQKGQLLSERLRDQIPDLNLLMHCGEGNLKSQLKKADQSGARLALILGEQELLEDIVVVKYLREDRPQENVPLTEIVSYLQKHLS